MGYVIEPGWLLAEDNLSDYRENKVNKNYNPSPRFLPSDNFRPKYSKFPSADNVVIYERTAKPLKEEKTPPPKIIKMLVMEIFVYLMKKTVKLIPTVLDT